MEGKMLHEVLKILEDNARLSLKQISDMTGIPRAEVTKLIKQAEDERIIMKYKAIINWGKVVDEQVWAWIEVKVTPEEEVGYDAMAERIYRFPQVTSAFLASGTYDLVLLVKGRNMHEVADFVSAKIAPIKGVQEVTTHFMLKRYKEAGAILNGEEEVKRQPVVL